MTAEQAPLRVLHVAQPHDGGVARCVVQLATGQARAGDDVAVACVPGTELFEAVLAAGLRALDWPAVRSPGPQVPVEARRLAALVQQVGPDVVHLHSAKAGLAGRLALRGAVPTVFQPHAWPFVAVTGAVRAAAVQWERWATRWTHVLVCVSEAERLQGERARTLPGTVRVIPNGVDTAVLTAASEQDRVEARARLGIGQQPLVVSVGRLSHEKGQDLALDAWPALRRAVAGAELALVGDGPDRAALAARGVDGVRLVGATPDVASWYAAADVVLLPSRREAMALTPLEAMARARSVVATDVYGVRESLPPGAGAIVAVGDPAALVAGLVPRLDGTVRPDEEGLVGRGNAVAHHDVGQVLRATRAAYELALGPGRAARTRS